MAADDAPAFLLAAAKPVTAWTTYADLTPDQRERFGAYVIAKEQVRAAAAANAKHNARADAALKATGGDKLAALSLMLNGGV
jgi:hypothetical protein